MMGNFAELIYEHLRSLWELFRISLQDNVTDRQTDSKTQMDNICTSLAPFEAKNLFQTFDKAKCNWVAFHLLFDTRYDSVCNNEVGRLNEIYYFSFPICPISQTA